MYVQRVAHAWWLPALLFVLLVARGAGAERGQSEPSLTQLLERAAAAAAAYASPTTAVIGIERGTQASYQLTVSTSDTMPTSTGNEVRAEGIPRGDSTPAGKAAWVAELAIIRTPNAERFGFPWLEFRDVTELDGRAVRDGRSRLAPLFQLAPALTLATAREVDEESAARSISPQSRRVSLPRMLSLVLHAANQSRFEFKKGPSRTIGDRTTWEIRYKEKKSPPLLKGKRAGSPCSGSLWVDPATGHLVQATLRTGENKNTYSELLVSYGLDESIGLWVPVSFKETSVDTDERLRTVTTATFGSWRRVEKVAW